MTDFAWWQRGVVYQIYPRSFNDTTDNGVGDLQGIIDKLDYLNDGTPESLGIDAIWISPFYPSPMADFGYDVADYCDVEALFGDLETFDTLVKEAHKRDIKIIIDYVPNHTSDQHEWFKESRSSRDNPKRDWYIWRDPADDGGLPNNWGNMFGGEAWTWNDHTEQYYFHQFAPEQPDLNWRNPNVREAMMDVLRFWMARGVDGFRMDVVYVVWKHPEMPDQPLIEGAKGRGETDKFQRQQQIYAFNYDGIHEIMREIRQVLDEEGAIGIAELWLSLDERMTYYGENMDEFHLPFNFDFITEQERNTWDADFFRERVEAYENAVPDGGWPNYVLGNHDIPRLMSRYGNHAARARVAALMLLTLRGTPTLYYGDEIGMQNGNIQPHQIQDPQGKILGVAHTRDVSRTPMQWSDAAQAGFSDSAETWLPISADYTYRNVAAQRKSDTSLLALYRMLLWYRKENGSLAVGDYETVRSPAGTYVYTRTHGDETHLIALNFTQKTVSIVLPRSGEMVLNTFLNRSGAISGEVTLGADEGMLVRLNS